MTITSLPIWTRSQRNGREDDESAENVSDFDNFLFDGTSDSEMENKSNKEKQGSKQKQLEIPTAIKKGEFLIKGKDKALLLESCFLYKLYEVAHFELFRI